MPESELDRVPGNSDAERLQNLKNAELHLESEIRRYRSRDWSTWNLTVNLVRTRCFIRALEARMKLSS